MTDIKDLERDDYVTYGTAVEQLEDDESASKKPTPVQEQVATDEKGRRRFHGAFTGGFSAGFFNTVGSIEGWAPRTFQSSRQQKNENRDQRPEDFMDSEDFTEHGIAPKKIITQDSFASRAGDGQKRKYGASSLPSQLGDLLAPLQESYGIILLKKMGWKPGQGIGPRITKREKYVRALRAGQNLQGTLQDAEEMDGRAKFKLFAPADVEAVKLDAKSNFHGIGYRGLSSSSELFSPTERFSLFDPPEARLAITAPTALSKAQKKKGMRGQAFGVGAFENDDEDIYSADDLSRYDKVLGGAEREDSARLPLKSIEAPGAPKVLEGFERGSKPLHTPKVYAPPELPASFHGLQPSGQRTQPAPAPPADTASVEPVQRKFQHDARSRNAIIESETKKPPVVSSVFDLIPANQRTRLPGFVKESVPSEEGVKTAPVQAPLVQAPVQASPPSPVASIEELRRNNLPLFGGPTSESKMSFRPFEKDPAKQQRYELFLKRRQEKNKDAIQEVWMDVGASMTEWERERERTEFFRAAALYRPMSGMMAARFTSGKGIEENSDVVEVPVNTSDVSKERKDAVEKKLYGKSTRDTFEWHPDRLLCKRFNVPNPFPSSTLVGLLTVKKDRLSVFNFLNNPTDTTSEKPTEQSDLQAPAPSDPLPVVPVPAHVPVVASKRLMLPGRPPTALSTPAEVEAVNPVPTERPPMDLFRAIFESSDVEEADDEEAETDLLPSVPSQPPLDSLQKLHEMDQITRKLENKVFPVAPSTPTVIGPAKPPPEVLAAYAAAEDMKARQAKEMDDSDPNRSRKKSKHKKAKSDKHSKSREHKKHKKARKKHHRKEVKSGAVDRVRKKSPVQSSPSSDSLPENVPSPDVVDDNTLLKKLKNALPGRRLTASDFM